jgi:hypothetical protein
MSLTYIYRFAAVALVLGGLLGVIAANLPIAHSGGPTVVVASPFYLASNLMFWFGSILIVLGWPAFYARQATTAGKLGLIGFVLMMLATLILDVVLAPLRAFIFPWLVQTHITASELRHLPNLYFVPAGFMLGLVGAILFGIATIRARVFPLWVGLLLLVGTPLTVLVESVRTYLPSPLHNVGDDIFRLSVVLFGYALWLRATSETRQSQAEPSTLRHRVESSAARAHSS